MGQGQMLFGTTNFDDNGRYSRTDLVSLYRKETRGQEDISREHSHVNRIRNDEFGIGAKFVAQDAAKSSIANETRFKKMSYWRTPNL
jgi:hypothetical protein